MQKQYQRKSQGFTIIETLIVLAIVGVIMIVVFLAVPALNRSSHNNQYKTEAGNILSAYQEVSGNKGGSALTATATNATDTNDVKSAANLKTLTTVTIIAQTTTAQTPALGTATIVLQSKCQAQNNNTPVNGTSRNVALIYQIESASGTATYQCVDE